MNLRVLLTSCASVVLLLTGCPRWQYDVTIKGVAFQQAKVDHRGFAIGLITQDTTIAGRPCKFGWVHLYPDGVPSAFTTAAPLTLPRLTIPADTWVRQNRQGAITICAFPRDTEVQGHACRGTGGPKGVQTAFYPNGALRQFYPPQSTLIDGVPCRSGMMSGWVELYEDGRLKSALLDRDWERDRVRYHRGERLEFDAGGRPHQQPLPQLDV